MDFLLLLLYLVLYKVFKCSYVCVCVVSADVDERARDASLLKYDSMSYHYSKLHFLFDEGKKV